MQAEDAKMGKDPPQVREGEEAAQRRKKQARLQTKRTEGKGAMALLGRRLVGVQAEEVVAQGDAGGGGREGEEANGWLTTSPASPRSRHGRRVARTREGSSTFCTVATRTAWRSTSPRPSSNRASTTILRGQGVGSAPPA